ncbi:hypothetical protein [Rhodococcus globerulus]|uniref:hypothetical protein n=1 Tax=Rhodococcus globerulus TaxID=33008 RepID=UPI000A8A3B0C|nr:hypothetical protein [Rhodococcus globerulus]
MQQSGVLGECARDLAGGVDPLGPQCGMGSGGVTGLKFESLLRASVRDRSASLPAN